MPDAVPFFTIVTATRNAAAVLPRLLESLAGQSCRDFELIIQDGASTDDTVAVAEARRELLPALSIVSVPDTGIYDAWNRALAHARGSWILFLGTDDSLYSSRALAEVQIWLKSLAQDIAFAGCSLVLTTQRGTPVEIWHPGKHPVSDLPNGMPFPHPALCYRRSLFARGGFSTTYRIAGDYDFLCRSLTDANSAACEVLLSRMSIGGISGSMPTMLDSELERLRISRRYFPKAWRLPLYARICRSALVCLIHSLIGLKGALIFADAVRWCRGKPSLWTRRDVPMPVPSARDDASPRFSLLIATFGRLEALRKLLASLSEQSCRSFEVLIADQNPPGFLDALTAEFQDTLPLRVLPVSPKGVSQARNALLPHVRGDLVAFPDDDCWYRPDTLEQALAFFEAKPHVHGVFGQWHDPAGAIRPRPFRLRRAITRFSAFQRGETFVQFYRKALVDVVGGFDPELGPGTGLPYGSGEDTDYVLRALDAGFTVVYAPEVQIYHPDAFRISHSPGMIRSYATGRMRLLRKHKLPFWFKLANIAYPLLCLPFEGKKAWTYRKTMFFARLAGLLDGEKI